MGLFDFLGRNKNQGPQSKEAFFLSEDEAKTFGDIDYMRKEVVIRRTFAKKKGMEEEMESVKSISASTAKAVGEAAQPATTSFSAPAVSTFGVPTPVATPAPVAETTPAVASTSAPEAPVAESVDETPAAEASATSQEPAVRRTPDTSMDMFRNMAKNIRR